MVLTQGLLPFHLELVDSPELVTSFAAIPLVVETLRAVIDHARYRVLRDALGYQDWRVVRRHLESVIVLVAAGGEHVSDLDRLRADRGLEKLLGGPLSSPTQVKDFLYRFHQAEDGRRLTPKDDEQLSVRGRAQIRPEGPGLDALERFVLDVVEAHTRIRPLRTATLDVDATILAASKLAALMAYEGTVGYQPQMAWLAEARIWVCDEFRDGNVPAAFQVKAFLKRAFAHLPGGLQQRRLRADSALYDEEALTWADDQDIEFAVSADMSKALAARVAAIHEPDWRPYRSHSPSASKTEERQCPRAGPASFSTSSQGGVATTRRTARRSEPSPSACVPSRKTCLRRRLRRGDTSRSSPTWTGRVTGS